MLRCSSADLRERASAPKNHVEEGGGDGRLSRDLLLKDHFTPELHMEC